MTPGSAENLAALEKEFPFQAQIAEASCRTVTLKHLQRVLQYVSSSCASWPGASSIDLVTLEKVQEWVINPATKSKSWSFVELLSSQEQKPEWQVIGWCPGQRFANWVECVEYHLDMRGLTEDTPLWIRPFADREADRGSQEDHAVKAMSVAVGALLVLDGEAECTSSLQLTCGAVLSACFGQSKLLDIILRQAPSAAEHCVLLSDGLIPAEQSKEEKTYRGCGQQAKAEREVEFPASALRAGLQAEVDANGQDVSEVVRKIRGVFARAAWRQAVVSESVEEMNLAKIQAEDESRIGLILNFAFVTKEFDDDCLVAVSKALPKGLKELELDVRGCEKITNEGMKTLAEALPKGLQRLRLIFWRCERINDTGVGPLADRLPQGLVELCLDITSCRGVTDNSFTVIAEKMPAHLQTLELIIPYTKATDSGIALLAQKLPSTLSVLVLTISHCFQLSNKAMASIADKLQMLTVEKLKVDIRQCDLIGDPGLKALAKGLPASLKELDLCVKDTGVSADNVQHSKDIESMRAYAAMPGGGCCALM